MSSADAPPPIGAIVLDTAPLLSNSVTATTLLKRTNLLYTTPGVVAEIRDSTARERYELQWKTFVKVRSPTRQAIEKVKQAATKTGDWEVLSAVDVGVLALAWEIEMEEQRKREAKSAVEAEEKPKEDVAEAETEAGAGEEASTEEPAKDESALTGLQPVEVEEEDENAEGDGVDEEKEADSDGWITPSNLHKHKAKAQAKKEALVAAEEPLAAAVITSDFAMQNVVLHLHLNLLSPTTTLRIHKIKTWVLRCHACFYITRQMDKQFCPRCGAADTLLRTSCSTDSKGNFRIFLKKNMQWRNRGNVYSLPKPTHGSSSGKGVPKAIILREDQKEYEREVAQLRRRKARDMLDPDYLPGILSGERRVGPGGKVKIGMGRRNPNEKQSVKKGKR